ncbi:deleted in malignant brain tumors 1 protein-like [Strongylocentrotus purpuratus]|uniref:SRCR domain-containing protein n=1 Tax=Strongylocentrotus purpuratus TaxID=7668 RepID=A0A7M7PMF1_STRPU|nr:deleted in malignant brain tumors 1 protein-like [Strongylocentrotus purpuratus]
MAASRSARFGQGAGDVLRVDCWGTEDSLADCPYFGVSFPCGHHMDAGAVCYLGAHPNPYQVRLVNGSDSAKGRVEVLRDGSWGTVCGVGWDLRDARVVCRMLGFDGALDAPGSARFGQVHPNPFKVRLVGGSNDAEGRVELLHGGSWGTICDDSWDLRDARVVCRMLGFGGALNAPGSARFGQGAGRIILDVVGCDGTEENVAECIHRGIGVHYCGHDEDAGAICYNGAHPNPFGIRLVDGFSKAEGRVEVFYDGSWGTICDNGWDLRDARVVCRMLGFEGALDAPTSARFGQGSGDILLNLVGCDGTEANLADCAHLGLGVNFCGHEEDVGAICYSGAHQNSVGIRLVGGSNSSEGRVEIRYNGTWGTVCDDGWDLQDAKVVCRMLGFGNASTAPGSSQFGEGNEDIFLSHVGCDGMEDNLADCAHLGFGVHNCQHNEDAGVTCLIGAHPNPFQVCLVGGSNDAEGRVEVLNDGSWGTICDNSWELRDARVVCRMMGFNGALDAPTTASFGQGSGRILLNYVSCEGTEDNLAECAHAGIGLNPCSHTKDAGAICYSGTHPNPFQIRLANGSNDTEGRVEVLYDGSWGTICDSWWDLRDARVVCRMLGFDGALDAPRSSRFGQGSGRILLNDVNCDGNEDNLADCAHAEIDLNSCSHTSDAGAICYTGANPTPFDVHLIGGSNEAEGRVEVLYDGLLGTICDDSWDLRDARVVCRMLGFDGALEAPRSARFGQGSGRILLKDVICEGTEDNLTDCAHRGVGDYTSCSHAKDARVICYSGAHPQPFQVRLIGGSNDAEGRVEVTHDGSWGTICHLGWDLRDTRVVCRMLGFDGALEAPRSARFGQGSGRILLKNVNCEGTEDNLADCAHGGVGDYISCGHVSDAGVICYSGAHPQPFQVRLIAGSNDAEGRVEVTHDGSWGTICHLGWDLRDARVVCRMLGFDGALEAPRSARFGQGSGRILLKDVNCEGTEGNLADCAHRGVGDYTSCGHVRDAGIICYSGVNTTEPFQVRLTNGTTDSEGRVKVLYKGGWGTICDDSWDLRDARVVCKMLGFDGALAAPGSATFGAGSGKILFDDVGCKGTEETLAECYHRGFGVNNCEHDSDAGVICFIEVQLDNGADGYEGRVEILHEGSWGTVCDDSWDLNDAKVVCRQLGFDGALAALPQARFGQGSGDIFLDGVQCNGTETNLKDCKHKGIGVHNCIHKEDASVICRHGGNTMNPSLKK